MTTLRDFLRDFAHEIHNAVQVDTDGKTYIIDTDEDDLIEEYIQAIKARLIG